MKYLNIMLYMYKSCHTMEDKTLLQYKLFFFLMLFLSAYILFLFMYVCMYVWLCWVFVSVRGLSLVAASGGHSSSRCVGLSLSRPLLLGAQAPDAQAQ